MKKYLNFCSILSHFIIIFLKHEKGREREREIEREKERERGNFNLLIQLCWQGSRPTGNPGAFTEHRPSSKPGVFY